MINKKHEKLIKILINSNIELKAENLALKMGVSIRTIKNYIYDINIVYPNHINSSNKGYFIVEEDKEILKEKITSNYSKIDDRIIYILKEVIRKKVNINTLCDDLYVSLSTIRSDLKKIENEIKEYDLKLIYINDSIFIEGFEKNKRQMMSTILYKESIENYINIDSIQKEYKDINIYNIKKIILKTLNKNNYLINDYFLIDLIIHVLIQIDRIKTSNSFIEETKEVITLKTTEMSKEICSNLEKDYNVMFNEIEIYELSLLLATKTTSINYKKINKQNISEFIEKETLSLMEEIIKKIYKVYYVDLNKEEFLVRFSIHLKNLISRAKKQDYIRNPLAKQIKIQSPLIYEISIFVSSIISNKLGIKLNDDEIGYIAFHIGSISTNKENNKVSIVLYSSNYYDYTIKIEDQINKKLSEKIIIKKTINNLEDLRHIDYELVISTIPIDFIDKKNFLQINYLFNDRDLLRIENKIDDINKRKKEKVLKYNFKKYCSEELFEVNPSYSNEEELINSVSEKLYLRGYVKEDFREKVLERESMSSTSYGSFSIPHSMSMDSKKTAIYICVFKNPINWGEEKIKISLMMCFNKEDREDFHFLFDTIIGILTIPENINIISKSKSFDDFMKKVLFCLENNE